MNLKLELFNLRNQLTVDQLNESRVIQAYLENYDQYSEKEFVNHIQEDLNPYTYSQNIVSFLENASQEIDSKPLVYDLKDLYKKVERNNLGVLYRQPLVTILEIINRESDEMRMSGILNELSIYDWVPEIKNFLANVMNNPIQIQNMNGNGKGSHVYTIVEKIEEGVLAFVADRWFLVNENENEIKQVIADEYITDPDKMREIRVLEQIMSIAELDSETITFKIDEHLRIGVSTKDGSLYMNGEKLDKETTLEALFNTPVIPALKKDFYILCETTRSNIKKFVELDIALKVENPLIPYLENYCFNFKDKIYLYSKDNRRGSHFYQYENAMELIRDIQKELDYDVTKFYENKVSKEVKKLRSLEDREKAIDLKLNDVNESIDMLNQQQKLIVEDAGLRQTMNNLLVYKKKLHEELKNLQGQKIDTRKQIINQ
jgi:hypothetical protein